MSPAAYTDDPAPWRRLACRLLLDGALGAHACNPDDVAWVGSDAARRLAELAGLTHWPPRPGQLASRRELVERARELNPNDPDLQPPGHLGTTAANGRRLKRGDTRVSPWRQGPAVADAEWR